MENGPVMDLPGAPAAKPGLPGWALAFIVIGLVVVVGVAGMVVVQRQGKPHAYASVDGRYTIDFPGAPAESTKDIATAAGTITAHMTIFTDKFGGASYQVHYVDYPYARFGSVDAEARLEMAKNGAVNAIHGTVVQAEAFTLGDCDGIEAYVRIPSMQDKQMRMWLVMHGERMYTLIALPVTGRNRAKIETFFDSFAITE